MPLDAKAVRRCLALPAELAAAYRLELVVAIDELQVLGELGGKRGGIDPFPMIRSVWQAHPHVAYVVSWSERSLLLELSGSKSFRWRRPGGTVVPMSVIGSEAERQVAEELAKSGFDLVYCSRGSRGAFDLLATRGAAQLGVQVKRATLPLSFAKREWNRMAAEAARFGWTWLVAAVDEEGAVTLLDPAAAVLTRRARLGPDAAIANVLAWLD